jgi:hypothetical protein
MDNAELPQLFILNLLYALLFLNLSNTIIFIVILVHPVKLDHALWLFSQWLGEQNNDWGN